MSVTITVSNATRDRLRALKTTALNTYDKVIGMLLDEHAPPPPPPAATVDGITIMPQHMTLREGQTGQFTAHLHYSDGRTEPATSGVAWQGGNLSRVYVGPDGLAVARTAGETTVTARYATFSAQATLRVEAVVVVPPPTPTPTAKSTKFILVFPSDHSWGSKADIGAKFTTVVGDIVAWIKRETGRSIQAQIIIHDTPLTGRELATPPPNDVNQTVQIDRCGQGMHETTLALRVLRDELGLTERDDRHFVVVSDTAGGWAGGRHVRDANFGRGIVGHWELRDYVSGVPDAGCECIYGRGSGVCNPPTTVTDWRGMQVTRHPLWSFGHELLHGVDVDSHQPVVGLGDVLTDVQRAAILNSNEDFLL